jgi:aerobic carbon-monoxide dehydrogenase large subunit
MAPSRRLAASGFDRGGWESARVAIDSSGRATVYSGSMSQGHGHATALAQIAADALQMPVGNIDVVQGDTKQVQAGHGTFEAGRDLRILPALLALWTVQRSARLGSRART